MKNNEFDYIKYLFGYKRGIVISEQKNVVSEQTVDEINPKGLKQGDKGDDVVELQQKLIDMDKLVATKDWKSKKKGEKWTKPTGFFGVDTADALAKLEAEQNKPIEKQEPKLATIEQYSCLTDDNKSKWGKSIFYADGKVLLQGDSDGAEIPFSCGDDGNILVDGKNIKNSTPGWLALIEDGQSREYLDENQKYSLDKTEPMVRIDKNSNEDSDWCFYANVYEKISEDSKIIIYVYNDNYAERTDRNNKITETGYFNYGDGNLSFSWKKVGEESKTTDETSTETEKTETQPKKEWYYYDKDGKAIGPLTVTELKEKIDGNTTVWRSGMKEPTLAKNVKILGFSNQPPNRELKTITPKDRSGLKGYVGNPVSTSQPKPAPPLKTIGGQSQKQTNTGEPSEFGAPPEL